MSCAESSADGTGTSRIEVRRDAVDGYALAEAMMIDRRLSVSNVVGSSLGLSDWKRSGCLESARSQKTFRSVRMNSRSLKRS